MDVKHKWALLDILHHEEKLNEDKREELLDKELMTEEDYIKYYGMADDGHKDKEI